MKKVLAFLQNGCYSTKMETQQKAGCLNCRTTKVELGYYEFQNILGAIYQAYFCQPCFAMFQNEMGTATPAKQVEYHENLVKLITGKVFG